MELSLKIMFFFLNNMYISVFLVVNKIVIDEYNSKIFKIIKTVIRIFNFKT